MSVATPPAGRSRPILAQGDLERIRAITTAARVEGRARLLEPEGLEVLAAAGLATPRSLYLPLGQAADADLLGALSGDRVVVKVVGEAIVHKTEVGGVAIVRNDPAAVAGAMDDMARRLDAEAIAGFLLVGYVEHDAGLGSELLVSVRWTEAFGPVVTVGAGGIHAERLAADLRPGRELAVVTPATARADLPAILSCVTAVRLATEPQRGRPPLASLDGLVHVVMRLSSLAEVCVPADLLELEVNPLAVAPGGFMPLDVLAVIGDGRHRTPRRRPPERKLRALLEPSSIAVVGVSSGDNPGRTILRNILRDGFERARVTVVKPGLDEIDGCRCVPDVASVRPRPDLLVLALDARRSAAICDEVVRGDLAEAVIVIPGGLEETIAGRGFAATMRTALEETRRRAQEGPVLNGGNCLGIRSGPGHYDTLFIPATKLAPPSGRPAPLAIVAQSGAFAISRLSRLSALDPKYVITVGNQLDLTIGDHLDHLARDPDVEVVGVYVEGFAPLDGQLFLEASRAISRRGGVVVLYHAGRTPAGARASASHTASIAGDAVVTGALARDAGVVIAESIEAFDDLIGTFSRLAGRRIGGRRMAAVSNAGFECVAVGDAAGTLELVPFEGATRERLERALVEAGAAAVVEVHDPLDLTPMAGDAAFAAAVEAVLADPDVDVGLVGVVPFTSTLRTLPPGPSGEDLHAPDGIVARLASLWRSTEKAWVAVVDAGEAYDPFTAELGSAGIPTFRTADRALRSLAAVVEARLSRRHP
jgi:acyl-CoA synthetase (NDP forming)